jgi:adenine-specific DNA-methyltransferase
MSHAEQITLTSADITADRLAALKELIPEAFTEGKIDFAKLRAALGDFVDESPERYTFTWAGKRDAMRQLQAPTNATLVPAPEESINWDTTQHLFIEGDNLEVLKLLYKPYFGKVKLIYIDPPYNTGNDFIYPDDYKDPLRPYLQMTGQMDGEGNRFTSNSESSGRYHSAWLNMMYPRLFIARQLLRDDGVIFATIDDNEAANFVLLMNEIFGGENFITSIAWQKKVSPSNDSKWFSSDHDQLLVYAKNKEIWRPYRLPMNERQRSYYQNPDNDPRGPWNSSTYTCNKTKGERPNLYYPIVNPNTGHEVWPSETAVWAYSRDVNEEHAAANMLYWGKDGKAARPRFKKFLGKNASVVPRTVWSYSEVGSTQSATQALQSLLPGVKFETPKPPALVKRIVQIATLPNSSDIVLDFFAGSGTSAQAVLELNTENQGNRKVILVQLPEATYSADFPTIADIAKERIRRVIARQTAEQSPDAITDLGFRVFKLAPSHFRDWTGVTAPNPDDYVEQMSIFDDPLSRGVDPQAVIWEIAIKEGYPPTSQITLVAVPDHTVYCVTDPDADRSFHICLDDHVKHEVVLALGLAAEDLFICRDFALDDSTAANLALQCRLKVI